MSEAILLILLAVIGSFVLEWALIFILQTNTPFHTPISESMEPTLKVGDLLIIRGGLKAEDIHASPYNGDIIVFYNPSNPRSPPIVHRAIKKIWKNGKWYFVTKGDNNPADDLRLFGWLVPEDYVIGKVIFVVPKVGFVMRAMDETKINIGGCVITLRLILLAADLIALLYLCLSDETD
ncbi:signal peptidase I [Candidatus Bathyarchaeota archaeon]|nr:signal peptidase I [Candidatus Bathyarchaeota archaeon]